MARLSERSVLGRVQAILNCFDVVDNDLGLAELVQRTGLPKGTVHRLANHLVIWGILERTSGRYRLGTELFELGLRVPRQRSLRETALPYMEDLYEATHEVIHFGVLDGTEVLYLEKIMGHRRATTPSRVAGRMPLYCTAIGKALLAHGGSDLFEQVVAQGLTPRTPYTIVMPFVLKQQLVEVRRSGLSHDHEESAIGIGCVSAPVYGPGRRVIAALSITAPVHRYKPNRFRPAVLSSARALSREFGAR